jgi:hypothetical protein
MSIGATTTRFITVIPQANANIGGGTGSRSACSRRDAVEANQRSTPAR